MLRYTEFKLGILLKILVSDFSYCSIYTYITYILLINAQTRSDNIILSIVFMDLPMAVK